MEVNGNHDVFIGIAEGSESPLLERCELRLDQVLLEGVRLFRTAPGPRGDGRADRALDTRVRGITGDDYATQRNRCDDMGLVHRPCLLAR